MFKWFWTIFSLGAPEYTAGQTQRFVTRLQGFKRHDSESVNSKIKVYHFVIEFFKVSFIFSPFSTLDVSRLTVFSFIEPKRTLCLQIWIIIMTIIMNAKLTNIILDLNNLEDVIKKYNPLI